VHVFRVRVIFLAGTDKGHLPSVCSHQWAAVDTLPLRHEICRNSEVLGYRRQGWSVFVTCSPPSGSILESAVGLSFLRPSVTTLPPNPDYTTACHLVKTVSVGAICRHYLERLSGNAKMIE